MFAPASRMRGGSRAGLPFLIVLCLAAPGAAAGQEELEPSGTWERQRRLFKDSRAELALLAARGAPDARVLIASVPGGHGDVARAAEALGGVIEHRADAVGYLRVRVPLHAVERLAAHELVAAAGLSLGIVDLPVILLSDASASAAGTGNRPPGGPASDTLPEEWPPPRSDLPLRHPYSPLGDIDAEDFGPPGEPYDGRGVTVAVIDGTPDMLLPELRWARDIEGRRVPKIVDILNATDPRDSVEDRGSPQWVNMQDTVSAVAGVTRYQGGRYIAPRDGSFRIGLLNERLFQLPIGFSDVGGDLNRDGNPAGSDSVFAVLWDPRSGEVWVDTDQDRDFADAPAMYDYPFAQDIGVFGQDDPATELRESVGFTVQTDSAREFVSINVGVSGHGTLAAGAAVASREGGGRVDGVAPGARLVMVDRGRTLHGEIEAAIVAFEHPETDVIVHEQTTHPPYLVRDGRSVASIIFDRLVEMHDKPMLVPSGNQPGLTMVAAQAEGRRVLAVNAYQSSESFLIHHGIRVPARDNIHSAHSHGPSGDGRLKPDLLAPSRVLTIRPAFIPGRSLDGLYRLPPGYLAAGGTSTATPVAAGALARLIGAARREGVPHGAEHLRRAVAGSARFIRSIPANVQGNGLVQVSAAWDMLRESAELILPQFISRASVRTATSRWLTPPHEGEGIFEREGWVLGDSATRGIRLTRLSGPPQPVAFRTRWLGNTETTFAADSVILLPLGVEAALPVRIRPRGTGVHSAILLLEDGAGNVVHRILNTIVVADTFGSDNVISHRASLPRPGELSFFLSVPPGAAALAVDVKGPAGWDLWFYPPDGREQLIFAPWTPHRQRGVQNPTPGVWEVTLSHARDQWEFDESRPDPLPATPIALEARLLGAEVAGLMELVDAPDSSRATAGATGALTMNNRLAPFTGGLETVPLGAARIDARRIRNGERHVRSVQVPSGTAMLRLEVSTPDDAGADLDIYLFDCSAGKCHPQVSATDTGPDGPLLVTAPAAGEWRVVVDGASVASGSVSYEMTDILFHPKYGAMAVTDAAATRDHSSTWTAQAHLWVFCVPRERRPYAWSAVRAEGLGRQVRVAAATFEYETEPLYVGAAGALLHPGRSAMEVGRCDP